ncbi:MAG: glycine cleavage system aminomethyltransferase GcvT [Planctomycetota bacterium]
MRQTPLRDQHVALGARMVDFHGWEMPVQYRGILDETRCVRTRGGIFDLCHMGRLEITGPDRERLVEHVFSANLGKLKHGRAKYGFLLDEGGFPLDDVLVYRDHDLVHMVINATGRGHDGAWIESRRDAAGLDAHVREVSDQQAMIALQGPVSEAVLQPLCDADLGKLRYYAFTNATVRDVPTLIARTGYTGEDGFELFFDPAEAVATWKALLATGADHGLEPIGLGARDLLRLEAGMPLYGQEINTSIDPLEADLAFGVDLAKTGTVGIPALADRKARGQARHAVSLAAEGGRVPRTDTELFDAPENGERVGRVTSGGVSPTLGRTIARALVQTGHESLGTTLWADVRGKRWPLQVVPHPFYRRGA